MVEPTRVPAGEVHKKIKSGTALLVCAYEKDEKFKKHHLDGAISFNEFKKMKPDLSKSQEIIFYCA